MKAQHDKLGKRETIPVWRAMEPSPKPDTDFERARIVIVGTGPVGLALAIDLGQRGHDVIVLGRFDFVPSGSKAICFSKRSLEILDRLGCGQQALEKGVSWNVGKVFWKDSDTPVYQFDLLPMKNQKMPGFINIQQYHMEDILLERAEQLPNVQMFEDNFLIADVKMKEDRPSERWFWFDPPFNPGQSVLLHKQPDDVWRIDFQLGWDIDREACIRPENVNPLVRAMLGDDVEFEQEWYSVYTFQCRRMARFVHDRVVFAGDSAHLVSPFGARGCNGGFADIDNLGWKLDLVLRGSARPDLLESYNEEAIVTADENILNSTRSTDFLTPKSDISRAFRDAVLDLARDYPFARSLVNSGRLSTAVSYPSSGLNTPDTDAWNGGVAPGSPALDAPLGDGWLLERLGDRFVLLSNGPLADAPAGVEVLDLSQIPHKELLLDRFDLVDGAAYLIRPDQYVAARFRRPTGEKIAQALARVCGETP